MHARLAAALQQNNISAQLQSTCGCCCGHLDSPGPVNARLVADLQKKQPFSLACFSQLVDVCQRIIPKEITYLIIKVKAFPKSILINVQCTIFMNGTLGAHKSIILLVSIMDQVSLCPLLHTSLELHQPQLKGCRMAIIPS